jgi:hypothetical protein
VTTYDHDYTADDQAADSALGLAPLQHATCVFCGEQLHAAMCAPQRQYFADIKVWSDEVYERQWAWTKQLLAEHETRQRYHDEVAA